MIFSPANHFFHLRSKTRKPDSNFFFTKLGQCLASFGILIVYDFSQFVSV